MHIFLLIFFAYFARAQYNQRWEWVPVINAQGQPVLDAQGNPIFKAQWRPDRDPGTPLNDVLWTTTSNALPHGTELEYNCFRMPAICQNVQNWRGNTALSGWHTNSGFGDYFTFDLGASESTLDRGNARRELQCPSDWKTNPNGSPKCPMPGQPPVVPPLWDATGAPVTQLVPQIPGGPVNLKIADGRDQQWVGQLQDSGRRYSCDEFPPASWIEGGHGITGDPTATQGTTYCAPIGADCVGDYDQRGSEQNWQGSIHKVLSVALEADVVGQNLQVNRDTPIAFRFTTSTQAPTVVWAARVRYVMNGRVIEDPRRPGTHWERRSEDSQLGELLVVPVENGNGSWNVHLHNGEVFRPHEHRSLDPLVHRIRRLVRRDTQEPAVTEISSQEATKKWNVTAEDVDPALSTYRLQTQQDPSDAIDIIEWSKQIILGQIDSNNTRNSTSINSTTLHVRSHSHPRHLPSEISPYRPGLLQKRVDGPVQCGPGQPCLDGSCCSKDGKCGYKEAHCAPENCLSNCDAKAMCGIDSADGRTPCGLKLCCSFYGWCGTEEVHCNDPEPLIGKTPCQEGFGSCEIKPSPSCGKGSGTSKQRRIAYYQGWNTRERTCDKVYPRQINTRGITHLLYAFAFFHPQTFEMMPMNADDVPLYGEFTALKRNGLQTWIAVGGWSFNNPGAATYNAYSDMVSTQANRRAFIQSLIKFMETYGFQGADIDWEYPAEEKRGGRKEDTDNLVLLMQEMKEQFGGRFGSSLTLAPDYWYLRGFKPAAMQNYVDWMGFMSYDLHGPWDTDVKTLGSKVRPQTDITEIEKNLKPLWFDGVDPAKVVMGIAYYGRTYKLSDASCGKMGCGFIEGEGGAAGACTKFPGVLSNREIKQLIKDEDITPYFNETAMVKYFTYAGDSWVGYDDAETYALKEAFADDHCLGGIMIWSIDFDDETGLGLGDANEYKSPQSATVIPMAHTTVPRGQTFTLGPGAATDIPRLPNGGNQNSPVGPGASKCEECSFFRLITSTCCGTGGSVGNPIMIPAQVPTPMDIPLPPGLIPPQSFTDRDGASVPANVPLPRETIIPEGTIFTQPFLIAPGSSLREGEGEDQASNSSNLVWLSPEIWDDPNPQVQCFFPCTLVLPPYTSYTSTVDYPRITVTESGKPNTTLTFPPLTVTSWAPTTVVVSGRASCTNTESCTDDHDHQRTSTINLSTSSTWPWVTYTSSGTRYRTRPPGPAPTATIGPNPDPPGGGSSGGGDDPCHWPLCPPPPPRIPLPHLTINFGPPKPTTTPCAWPTLTCMPQPGTGPIPTAGPIPNILPIGPGSEEESEEEKEEFCLLQPSTTRRVTRTIVTTATSDFTTFIEPSKTSTEESTTTSTKTSTKKPEPTFKTPDWSQNKTMCYDSGQWTRRGRMIDAADKYCDNYLKGKTLTENWNPGEQKTQYNREPSEVVSVEIIAYAEALPGCKWKVDVNRCKQIFRDIIDRCDTHGENRKQGGRWENNCLRWRLDPNADL